MLLLLNVFDNAPVWRRVTNESWNNNGDETIGLVLGTVIPPFLSPPTHGIGSNSRLTVPY